MIKEILKAKTNLFKQLNKFYKWSKKVWKAYIELLKAKPNWEDMQW